MSDQCALDAHGNRLPAEDIVFYNSESDETPISSSKGSLPTRQRQTGRLAQSLAAEKQDDDGNSIAPRAPAAPVREIDSHLPAPGVAESSDEEDDDFVGSGAESDSDSDSCPSLMSLDNEEVFCPLFLPLLFFSLTVPHIAAMLPSKTFPSNVSRATGDSHKEEPHKAKNAKARERAKKRKQGADAGGAPPRKKSQRTSVEEVEDEGETPRRGGGSGNIASGAKTGRTRNLIYLFYESVDKGADGSPGAPGDKHFKCYHGSRKVLTITRAMKSSLNGLQTHLRTKFPIMNRLYEAMSRHQTPPTQQEIDLARGATVMDAAAAAEYLGNARDVLAPDLSMHPGKI
ncbi:hypothetical protein B0H13DRAFT_2347527 [Mycena leptocephala]|nr:hypothetical protein B0H13DRAFT_2347527 [Mycena leptocephala]